ncbi:hypothetical protein V2S66_00860 [Streptomyces sp. V4-01]|uniref:Regulatory protein n=1 Tax=Actinacidiphila polyblastidii TaxID=3110430 RepID=A0ABU7P3Y7_9ACTN|nr:hypothetical protein [Streptomyces sp. V4-01]
MADNATLKAQYLTQVEADLERNTKEKDRIATDLAALQEQLAVLEEDHALLVGVRQTLVGQAEAAAVTPAEVPVAAPAEAPVETPAEAPAAVVPRARKPRTAARKPKAAAPKKAKAAKAGVAEGGSAATAPTLVELVTAHLTGGAEPRSAAEIGTTLTQAHPDRKIQTTVVRNTLEALVAKGQALRSRQGRSVYYSAPEKVTASA